MGPIDLDKLISSVRTVDAIEAASTIRKTIADALPGGASLQALGDYADNPAHDPHNRVLALFAAGQLSAIRGVDLPEVFEDLLDDPLVLDAAFDNNLTPALTGILYALPKRPTIQQIRMSVGTRMAASNMWGSHVTRVLLDAEDFKGAAAAAAQNYFTQIQHKPDHRRQLWFHTFQKNSDSYFDEWTIPVIARIYSLSDKAYTQFQNDCETFLKPSQSKESILAAIRATVN